MTTQSNLANAASGIITTLPTIVGQYATVGITRTASYSGGTPGNTVAGLRVDVTVGAAVTDFEWAIVGVCYNSAAAGENVGGFFQGRMQSTGATWGGVCQVIDTNYSGNLGSGRQGLVGLEVDCTFNGTDSLGNRVGLNVVAADAHYSILGTAGTAGNAWYGILVNSEYQTNPSSANCQFQYGIVIGSATTAAFVSNVTLNTLPHAFVVQGSVNTGFDTSTATINSAAYQMASGQAISFDAAAVNQLSYQPAIGGGTGGLDYVVSGTGKVQLLSDGSISLLGPSHGVRVQGITNTGGTTPLLTANKPGGSTSIGAWISVLIDGSQYWIPAWTN